MKTTIPAIRKIIRQELRRALIAEAKMALMSSVSLHLLREWNESSKTQQANKTGYRHHGDPKDLVGSKQDKNKESAEVMQSALRLLDDASKNERIDIGTVIKQLEKVYGTLKNAGDTAKSTAWAAGVANAINILKKVQSPDSDPKQRKYRFNLAKDSIVSLGRDIDA